MPINMMRRFLQAEASGGIILFFAAVLAIILDNSPFSPLYNSFLQMPAAIHIGPLHLDKPLLMWINDGLMVLFFLSVGLELKRELVQGHLAQASHVILPAVAAFGGMLVPALIYIYINYHSPDTFNGWAIPVATDIAFALGVLSLFGRRVPTPLKLFLLTATIFDDIGAIIIIAIFHSGDLSYLSLGIGAVCVVILVVMNIIGVKKLSAYLLVGAVLWICVLKSGVHATLAGVILALLIPIDRTDQSPLHRLEEGLLPWISFLILPVFAFANAGVSFTGSAVSMFSGPLVWGVIFGLFIGKQVGIFAFTWAFVKLRLAKLPKGITWPSLYSISVLCGIGFTMSLFIGSLAFTEELSSYMVSVRFSVLIASLLSGILACFLLHISLRKSQS